MDINNLSYEELQELAARVEKRQVELYAEYSCKKQREYKENFEKREAKKEEFKKNELPKIKDWLKNNLIPNETIIKVKGARDGKGIRLFMGFSGKGDWQKLECRQIIQQRFPKRNKTGDQYWWETKESLGQITEHLTDKVTHVKIGADFVKITELIK
jgi:hypothetical protein